jgi:hypothetical protein
MVVMVAGSGVVPRVRVVAMMMMMMVPVVAVVPLPLYLADAILTMIADVVGAANKRENVVLGVLGERRYEGYFVRVRRLT